MAECCWGARPAGLRWLRYTYGKLLDEVDYRFRVIFCPLPPPRFATATTS